MSKQPIPMQPKFTEQKLCFMHADHSLKNSSGVASSECEVCIKERQAVEIAQGRQHFRSIEEYLAERGWSPHRFTPGGSGWTKGQVGPMHTREAREKQMRDDEDAGWRIDSLGMVKP